METPVNSVLTHCFLQAHSQSLFPAFQRCTLFFLVHCWKDVRLEMRLRTCIHHLFQCLFKRGQMHGSKYQEGANTNPRDGGNPLLNIGKANCQRGANQSSRTNLPPEIHLVTVVCFFKSQEGFDLITTTPFKT